MYYSIAINLLVLVYLVDPIRGIPASVSGGPGAFPDPTPNELFSGAARRGDTTEMLRLMTNESIIIDVNHPDDRGRSPLLHAANAGHHKAVEILLDAGADPHSRGHDGDTAFFWAASSGHVHIMHTLLDTGNIDVDGMDVRNSTPLFAAACNCRSSAIKLLLDLDADPNTSDYRNISPIMCARYAGCDNCIRLLRAAGAVNIDWMESILHPLGG